MRVAERLLKLTYRPWPRALHRARRPKLGIPHPSESAQVRERQLIRAYGVPRRQARGDPITLPRRLPVHSRLLGHLPEQLPEIRVIQAGQALQLDEGIPHIEGTALPFPGKRTDLLEDRLCGSFPGREGVDGRREWVSFHGFEGSARVKVQRCLDRFHDCGDSIRRGTCGVNHRLCCKPAGFSE